MFFENLELGDFPVDVQDLTITLKTSRKSSELDFFQNTIHKIINYCVERRAPWSGGRPSDCGAGGPRFESRRFSFA